MKKWIFVAGLSVLPGLAMAIPAKPQREMENHQRQAQKQATSDCDMSAYLTGDWGGYRCKLINDGVNITGSYTSDTMFNISGGRSRGGGYASSWGLNFDFDLAKLIGLKNTSFYFNLVQRSGTNIAKTRIGNLFSLQQVYGNETFIVDAIYLKYQFGNSEDWFKFGRLNAGDDFMQSDIYYQFVSNGIDGNPVGVFFNMPFSSYPNAQWGAYIQGEPINHIIGRFGVYNTADVAHSRYHGLFTPFVSENGVMLTTEWDYIQNNNANGLPAKYGVGFLYVTGKNQTNFTNGQQVRGNYGVYYQITQMFTRPNGPGTKQGLSGFVAMQFYPQDRNQIPFFSISGLTYTGLLPSRPDDTLGVAYVYGKMSRDLANLQSANGALPQNFEAVIELNYRVQVNKWFYVEPTTQYILHPGGTGSIPDAWAVGFQVGVTF